MECLLTLGAIFVVACIALGMLSHFHGRRDQLSRALKAVNQRFSGHFTGYGLWGNASVRFRYGATHVVVDATSQRPLKQFRVKINMPYADFDCKIQPRNRQQPTETATALVDVGFDASFLGGQYHLLSNDPKEMRQFVSPGVGLQLEHLRSLFHGADFFVTIRRDVLTVEKEVSQFKPADIVQWVQLVLDLYDQVKLTRTTGIEFVQESVVQPIAEAVCQVCGESLGADVVLCRRCKTPHHLDCWYYYGGCSIYGCSEPDYVKPQVARLAGPPPAEEVGNDDAVE